MKRIILVRHGQTDANIDHLLQGHGDGQLTETGRIQAEKLAIHMKTIAFDYVLTSDLSRARITAERIAKISEKPIEIDQNLREWNVGVLDGQPAKALREALDQPYVEMLEYKPMGGESLKELRARAENVYTDYTRRFKNKAIVICSHGDFLRQFLGVMTAADIEISMRQPFGNTSFSIFDREGSHQWHVVTLNNSTHL